MADQVTRAFADFVAAQCARSPVVIVLEDLHWGDAPSIALVDAALRACRDLPLMVLAFARPELRERHPGLWSERGATELVLPELGKKPAERLVRAVLGESAEPTVIARIIEQSGGNAFFLEELIRAVAEGRKSDLPDSVVAMAQARLEALEPDARRVLRAAAIFGQSFTRPAVAALLAPFDVEPWLEELARRELLQRRNDVFVFRHAFVREAAYGLLTPKIACSDIASRASGWRNTTSATPACSPTISNAEAIARGQPASIAAPPSRRSTPTISRSLGRRPSTPSRPARAAKTSSSARASSPR